MNSLKSEEWENLLQDMRFLEKGKVIAFLLVYKKTRAGRTFLQMKNVIFLLYFRQIVLFLYCKEKTADEVRQRQIESRPF